MLLRLAFALATPRESEILLIDEIIGVGDATFFLQDIYSSTEPGAAMWIICRCQDDPLRQLCDKAIWLNRGSLVRDGISKPLLTNEQVRHPVWFEKGF
jgi:homopolymeric O-antigen transport system ATP-binding protein